MNCHFSDMRKNMSLRRDIFCICLTVAWCLGRYMEECSSLTCKVLVLLTVVSVIIGWLLSQAAGMAYLLLKKVYGISSEVLTKVRTSEVLFRGKGFSDKIWFIMETLFLIAAWFPVFLAYYPGIFAYDVLAQMYQRLYGYSTHHPLIHTLLLGWFYDMGGKLGNVNYGIALYSLFQMLALALAVSYMMYFLRRQKMPVVFRAAVLIFMGLMPVVSMLSISATKDTLFSAFFLVVFTLLCEFCLEPESIRIPWKAVLFTACAVLACLFRNQGKYVLCVTLLLWLVLMPEKTKKRCAVIFALTACIYLVSDAALVTATDASAGSANEFCSVPYQQLARVYNYEKDDLDAQTTAYLEEIMPHIATYELYKADHAKNDATGLEEPSKFFKTWLSLGTKYPLRYLEAFLYNTFDYWYPDGNSCASVYGYGLEDRQGYLLTDTKSGFGVEHTSLFPKLEALYERLFSANEYQNIPVVSKVFHLSLYIWLPVGIAVAFVGKAGIRKQAAPVVMLAAFVGTLLLGPCALPRYILPVMLCIPAFYAFMKRSAGKGRAAG